MKTPYNQSTFRPACRVTVVTAVVLVFAAAERGKLFRYIGYVLLDLNDNQDGAWPIRYGHSEPADKKRTNTPGSLQITSDKISPARR